jgi:hypothetical protein
LDLMNSLRLKQFKSEQEPEITSSNKI